MQTVILLDDILQTVMLLHGTLQTVILLDGIMQTVILLARQSTRYLQKEETVRDMYLFGQHTQAQFLK